MLRNTSFNPLLFEYSQDMLLLLDASGTIIYSNQSAKNLFGVGESTPAEDNLCNLLLTPEDFESIKNLAVNTVDWSQPIKVTFRTVKSVLIKTDVRVFLGHYTGKQVIVCLGQVTKESNKTIELFRSVFDNSQIGMILMKERTGKIVAANREFEKLFLQSSQNLIGSSVLDFGFIKDQEQLATLRKILQQRGNVRNYSVTITTNDGINLDTLMSIDRISLLGFDYLLFSFNNITQLRQTELKTRKLLIQTKLIADISMLLNSPDDFRNGINKAIALIGEHTNVSRVYIFEDSSDSLSTSNTYEWCNHGISPQIKELQQIPYQLIPSWRELLKSKGRIFSQNVTSLPDDIQKMLKPQEITSILAYPIYLENTICGFIGFDECTNIREWATEEQELLRTITNVIANALHRKKLFDQIHEDQLRLQLTIESAREGQWDWNITTGDVKFSSLWLDMLGYTPEDIPGHISSWEKIVHPEDTQMVNEVLAEHLSGKKEYYETAHRVMTKQGTWKWILDHGKVVAWDEQGRPTRALGTHIDISEQKEAEAKLRSLITTKDKFFSIISHDLKNPFMTLLSFTELLTLYYDDFSADEVKDNLNEIYRTAKNTYALLENLLTWSRSQRGEITISPKNTNVSELIESTIAVQKPTAMKKQIALRNNCDSSFVCYTDYDTTATTIRNIISNAIKFTSTGGSVNISCTQSEKYINILVSDTGIGMSEETLQKLFKIEVSQSTEGTANEKGTGLGLFLCKEFAELNGGHIRIESSDLHGTTVCLQLPHAVSLC